MSLRSLSFFCSDTRRKRGAVLGGWGGGGQDCCLTLLHAHDDGADIPHERLSAEAKLGKLKMGH